MTEAKPQAGEPVCPDCDGTGERDSGGVYPWGEGIFVACGVCNGTGRAAVPVKQEPPAVQAETQAPAATGRYWLIHFDDADKSLEVFTEESSARTRFQMATVNWNCKLFAEVESSPRREPPQPEPVWPQPPIPSTLCANCLHYEQYHTSGVIEGTTRGCTQCACPGFESAPI